MLNIFQFNRNVRSIRRYRNIIIVLFKYGFDQLLEHLNLYHLIAAAKAAAPGRVENRLYSPPSGAAKRAGAISSSSADYHQRCHPRNLWLSLPAQDDVLFFEGSWPIH
jgi:hypothetical protein